MTPNQKATVDRMLAAPAGGWILTKTLRLKNLPSDKVAVQLESRSLGVWGIVLPSGEFIKPKPGRKTIDAADVAWQL